MKHTHTHWEAASDNLSAGQIKIGMIERCRTSDISLQVSGLQGKKKTTNSLFILLSKVQLNKH